tara:strand:+ start:696 stop:1301 length:606 start_codon:yes stop_codon:yes gene_type:complete
MTTRKKSKKNKCSSSFKEAIAILASEITEHRAQATIRCANNIRKRKPRYLGKTLISNKFVAKPVCSWYNPETFQYETVKGPNPLTQNCQRTTTLPIKGRLGYTRINKNWCNTTKTLTVGTSSSEQIAKRKQRAYLCPCGPKQDTCVPNCDNDKREKARYCYPRPFHTGKNCGLSLGLTKLQKEACRLGCPKYWNSGNLRLR